MEGRASEACHAIRIAPRDMIAPPVSSALLREVKTTCCYCGVGCGVLAQTDGINILSVRGDPEHPANFGRLCSKGASLHLTAQANVTSQVRLLHPQIRASRDAERVAASWDDSYALLAERFASTIAEHGPDSVGFYISGQLLTEDYYVFNKLAKGLIGTNNIDTNSRLCMSSAVAGYKQTLGADAPPCSYEDIEHASLIFIIGANPAYAHPVLYRRIEAARAANAQLKVIVADPRRTDSARDADLFLPILPGTDVALLNGMLHICLWEELHDARFIAEHTEGFAELKQTLRDFTPAYVAKLCGISETQLLTAARWFGTADAALSLYCQGMNQSSSGTAKNAALINLHLATRQIGKVGAGPFSLTGQPNAMGGREVGGMANLLSGHRDLANATHRAEVAALWGVPSVPEKPGKTAVEMFEAVRAGQIKILWIACTNPAQSLPDQKLVRAALEKAELVIVQEAFSNTATIPYADVLLPATTWGEKHGTVTNSERRISRCHAVLPKPGQTKHDWEIVCEFAQVLEGKFSTSLQPHETQISLFPYQEPEQIWREHQATTLGRDLDIGGLSYEMLAAAPQQWPFPVGALSGKARLYEDGVFATANGRARFVNTRYVPLAEAVDARYPFHLNTGRLRDQWHGMSRTGTVAQAFAHAPTPQVVLAHSDMHLRFLQDGDLVQLTSRRGSQILPVVGSEDIRQGQAFVAMHWGEEYVSGHAEDGSHNFGVNGLTLPALDPSSKQPELKNAAIKIAKLDLPWHLQVFAWVDDAHALQLQMKMRAYFKHFAFASCTLFGRELTGVYWRAADHFVAPDALLAEILQHFELDGAEVLRYEDKKRGHARHIALHEGKLRAVALAGDVAASAWLKSYLESSLPVAELGRSLLQPTKQAPAGFVAQGRVVCNCLNVSEEAITSYLHTANPADAASRLCDLQQKLQCGTSCGSCVPELKRMVQMSMRAA